MSDELDGSEYSEMYVCMYENDKLEKTLRSRFSVYASSVILSILIAPLRSRHNTTRCALCVVRIKYITRRA